MPRPITFDPKSVKRAVRTVTIVLIVLFVLGVLLGSVGMYTDYLWFVHDVRQPQVFTRGLEAKGTLFFGAFLVTWAFLYFNLRRALKLALIYADTPGSIGTMVISHTMKWIQDSGPSFVRILTPIASFLMASGFSNEWMDYLMWRHGKSFGTPDPMFGLDAGFYVFSLPWYQAVCGYLLWLTIVTTVLVVALYIGLQSLGAVAKIELSRPGFRFHVGLLVGLTLLLIAGSLWLGTYGFVLTPTAQFVGAGFVENQVVGLQRVLAVLVALLGLATVATSNTGKPFAVPVKGGVVCLGYWLLTMAVWPVIARHLIVDPDRLGKEGPFAARAIQMTRVAFGLDKIEVRNMEVKDRPSDQEIAQSQSTLDNMRLWDPEILRRTLETLQGFRPYYQFKDVDVDRYTIDGKQTMVMLAPRDLKLTGLQADAQNWTNMRLRYTHGYGVDMARVNSATSDGRPNYVLRDIPVASSGGVTLNQPRIYFSDWSQSSDEPTSEYALVNTGEKELDYETASGSSSTRWEGTRGIPISGFLTRLAFSIVLGDGNLLVSPNVRAGAKLLMRRNVTERASALYPFLKFDQDPYIVILGGRLVWVLDAYTSTDKFPYSATYADVNYLRNSVKVTIDAYTGDCAAYAIEPNEPILQCFRGIYPGLVKNLDQAPAGLVEHFRYPEDLLGAQAVMLQTYHVTDPVTFLSNSDAWNIAVERDLNGQSAPIRPYYVEMKLPDEPQSGFLQILPMTPNGKPNMSGWLAAHCDPGHYGRMTLYRFVGSSLPKGPEQMESDFNATPEISNINRQYNNDESKVITGNLLVIPIGQSLMYVEPLFLQSKTLGIQAAPRLSWVVLAFNDQIVVGSDYKDALAKLLGSQGTPSVVPPRATSPGMTAPPPTKVSGAKQALDLLDQADAAMRAGDWAKYGELQKQLKTKLQELAGAK